MEVAPCRTGSSEVIQRASRESRVGGRELRLRASPKVSGHRATLPGADIAVYYPTDPFRTLLNVVSRFERLAMFPKSHHFIPGSQLGIALRVEVQVDDGTAASIDVGWDPFQTASQHEARIQELHVELEGTTPRSPPERRSLEPFPPPRRARLYNLLVSPGSEFVHGFQCVAIATSGLIGSIPNSACGSRPG